jgi:hypothetical protein
MRCVQSLMDLGVDQNVLIADPPVEVMGWIESVYSTLCVPLEGNVICQSVEGATETFYSTGRLRSLLRENPLPYKVEKRLILDIATVLMREMGL